MAATESPVPWLALALVAALPSAHADTAPEQGQISYKYLDYQDSQPGWDRVGVRAHALSIQVPVAGEWALEGSWTADTVSGASPSFHSEALGSGHLEDERRARDLKITRYFSRGTLTVGWADSRENDYRSRASTVSGSVSTEDRNTTVLFGLGHTSDHIDVASIGLHEPKRLRDVMLGVAQVLSPTDIVQLTVTHATGHGYFSDPYKYRDHRPETKHQTAWLGRWNHHFTATDGTARLSYRYYRDSFGVRAHTLGAEYVQPWGSWTFTPLLRLHTQSAAWFYLDPENPGFPTIRPVETIQSQDQRLSAFGAMSLGLKVSRRLTPQWTADARYETYRQTASGLPFGTGSPGIEPFRARMIQLGLTFSF
ncbi:DUF3570 domain-containing protein [Vitreoscilla filiformis]|uniref:DUF3570 domain-containing protein n=1 Tax=Vitreoscilla filiformis TaxID=63 RepID=UPI0018DFF369|nr:DUF3570 domain-containing protein [Vitreoscilla filiformis]